MTSSTPASGGIDANSRGIAVLIAAVVVGFLLLLNAGTSDSSTNAAGDPPATTIDTSGLDDPETTTTVPGDDGTTTTETGTTEPDRQPGDVVVAVLNGGGPAGTAGATSSTITDSGYQAGTVGNITPGVAELDTTKVYYAEGYQAEATAVAGLLGKSDDAVEALPSPPPGSGLEAANVVVVLGRDTPPVGSESATTTTVAN